ncbi:DUF882 domain-containing protein [Pseudochelatococcus sp. G4_1912]|uniref:DUF882 domain-containing protein n=1 Tax=Pseudochelatococcus sp. G4_1912 TaxID=3114288 RepID=UPI0039C622CB
MHSTRARLRPRLNGWVSGSSQEGAPGHTLNQDTLLNGAFGKSRLLRQTALGALGLATIITTLLAGTGGLQNAVANGDTRTLSFYHAHTRESLTVTFRRNGRYDQAELQKLNWFLRDWRNNDTVAMDPKLFDIVWAAQREVGSTGKVKVLSAYRSPKTNAMLRRRSSAVAKNSQHMVGKALDFQFTDADMSQVRAVGMRMQRGGVGYYANVPFVHLDSGSVRSWPRMPRAQLARLFPDGRTVHLPAEGTPLEGFEAAKQMILARGDSVPGISAAAVAEVSRQPEKRRSLWAALFGGADEEEDAEVADTSRRQVVASASRGRPSTNVAPDMDGDDSDPRRFFVRNNAASASRVAPPVVRSAPAPEPDPVPVAAPEVVPVAAPIPLPVPSPQPEAVPTIIARTQPTPIVAFTPLRGDAIFDGPMPASRPASLTPGGTLAAAEPMLAMLPQPPRRPGQPVPATLPAVAANGFGGVMGANAGAMTLASIPTPPLRPAELAPEADRNALAAIAAASRSWNAESGADRSIRTAALAYTAEPEIIPPPLPPLRPAGVQLAVAAGVPQTRPAQQVRLSPSLPPGVKHDERQTLNQLFAMVATEAKPSPRAKVSTAKVISTRPAARAAAPVNAVAPTVVVQMGFTKDASASDLKTNIFTGPAVKPLPIAKFTQQ